MFSFLVLNVWFVTSAKGVLKDIVESKSGGRLKLDLSHVRFNFFSKQLQISEGDLLSTDTVTATVSYHVKFSKLTFKVHSYWPLLLKKDLLLDSINIHNPVIEVLQWRRDTSLTNTKDELSITQEMGRLYNSLVDVLQDFGIRRIIVNNAGISLINKMKPGSSPVSLTNIYLNVLRKPNDRNNREQSVDLTTTYQNISLPGGRHQLSFKNFQLQLFRKRIELDSCTVTAMANDSSSSSYKIFFKKLMLIGVDFSAMSVLDLIRADSVYCENPIFNIQLNPSDAVSKKKERPDPEKIVKELTTDLDLAFVGVKNAGIKINIVGKRPRSIFNSNKDNFEMRGLRISSDSTIPVKVQRFDMLVRDYHLYNMDSSSAFSFDSIHFINSKIILNNFSVITTPSKYKLKSQRDFRIPHFELTGLDWYQLVFEQNIKAREAVLTNPIINYIKRTPKLETKKTNLFSSLQSLDSLMTLERLSIIDGQVNLNFGEATSLNLEKVNLSVSSNKLLLATNQEGLRRAVDHFSISNGTLKRKDIIAQLSKVRYEPNNQVYADELIINSVSNNVKALISDVFINNMLLDEETETIIADGLQWKNAKVELRTNAVEKNNRKDLGGTFDIKKIVGNNTQLTLSNGISAINSSVQLLKLNSLNKVNGGPVKVDGIFFSNSRLTIGNNAGKTNATIDEINVDDLNLENDAKDISANGVRWSNAVVDIKSGTKAKKKTSNGSINVTNVEGSNTRVIVENGNGEISSAVDLFKASAIQKNGNEPLQTKGILIAGNNLLMNSKMLQAKAAAYQLADDQPSFVSQLNLEQTSSNDSLSINSSLINFSADINAMLANDFHLKNVQAIQPGIKVSKWNTTAVTDTTAKNTSLRIDQVSVKQPEISITTHRNDSVTHISISPGDSSEIDADDIAINSNGIKVGSASANNVAATFVNSNGQTIGAEDDKINMNLSNLYFRKKDGKPSWSGVINKLNFTHTNTFEVGFKKNKLTLAQASMGNINLSSDNIRDIPHLLKTNSSAWVQTSNGQYVDSNSKITWHNARYTTQGNTLSLDSFSLTPLKSQDSVILNTPYQVDYLTLKTGAVKFTGFDLQKFNTDSSVFANSMDITNPSITIYRDKLPPNLSTSIKQLPAKAISNIKLPVFVQKINIADGIVNYSERQEKSRAEGTLLFTRINGSIENIKNRVNTNSDSLTANFSAYLMDKALLSLRIKESYTDTAGSFMMTLGLEPTKLSVLNPVMVPFSNVKITSGSIDSLKLEAIAKEYFAFGKMNMFYHDLRIKLIRDGNPDKSNLKDKAISFLANTFFIKNNNTSRKGLVYFERLRDKSFFNYLLKITLSGMGSSVGVAKNRKYRNEYREQVRTRGLSY